MILADGRYRAARRELLIVEIRRRDALIRKPLPHRLHHRRWAAKINVDLAAVEVLGLDVAGDVALVGVGGAFIRNAAAEGEIRICLVKASSCSTPTRSGSFVTP